MFKLNLSIFSPLYTSISKLAPTPPTNRQPFAPEKNVNFNVIILAFPIPWVLTMLHSRIPPIMDNWENHLDVPLFKTLCETTLARYGEMG
jgi:hypothetical protein